MVLEIHTEYDIPHLEELQRVLSAAVNPEAAKKSKKTYFLLGMVMMIAGVVLLMVSETPLVSSAIMAVLGIVCMERGVNFFKYAAKNIRRKMNRDFTGNDYILDELGIRVENVTGVLEFAYADCDRLLETNQNIYIMLNDGQGLILDKTNVVGGTAEELRTWLEENCQKNLEKIDMKSK